MTANVVQRILFRTSAVCVRPTGSLRQDFLTFRRAPAVCRCIHESGGNTNVTSSLPDAESAQGENVVERVSENDRVNPNFVNRNPRNLERMALARKDKGWAQSHPRKDYWHKLFIQKTNRHITAYIEHIHGRRVVEASSQEWAIKQHLYSTSDVCASRNVGRVLAQRCMESGINYVHVNIRPAARTHERTRVFLAALKEGGVILNEPKSITDFRQQVDYFPQVD